MRVDMQSSMLNYFHMYAVNTRVFSDENAQKQPSYGELLCLHLQDILPTFNDKQQIERNYCIHFARIICQYIPFYKTRFADCVPKHIMHQHSAEMSQKSEVVRKN